jgi:hypothetical protein
MPSAAAAIAAAVAAALAGATRAASRRRAARAPGNFPSPRRKGWPIAPATFDEEEHDSMLACKALLRLAGLGAACAAVWTAPAVAQGPMTIAKEVKVSPGELSGKILQSGTRDPAEGHTMTLRSMDGQEVAKVTTAADGTYTTPALQDGSYVLEVAQGMNLKLDVGPGASIKSLDIVVPQQVLAAASAPAAPAAPGGAAASQVGGTPAGSGAPGAAGAQASGGAPGAPASAGVAGGGAGAPGATSGGLGTVGWGLIGVGAAAAIAVPIAIAASDSSEGVVSPTTPAARQR